MNSVKHQHRILMYSPHSDEVEEYIFRGKKNAFIIIPPYRIQRSESFRLLHLAGCIRYLANGTNYQRHRDFTLDIDEGCKFILALIFWQSTHLLFDSVYYSARLLFEDVALLGSRKGDLPRFSSE